MAERRMFAKSIVLSDAFLDMPMSARCLYFTLSMFADDDGFVGSPKAIMRQCGASQDDLVILLQKRYVLGFESGVIVIKHWRINNFLRKDRHVDTTYLEELAQLTTDAKGAYTEARPNAVDQRSTNGQPSIDKDRLVQGRLEEDRLDQDREEITPTTSPAREETVPPIGVVIGAYESAFARFPAQLIIDEMRSYLQKLDPEVIEHGIQLAASEGIYKWSYVRGVLDRYVNMQASTLAAAQAYDQEYREYRRELSKSQERRPRSGGPMSPEEKRKQEEADAKAIEQIERLRRKMEGEKHE